MYGARYVEIYDMLMRGRGKDYAAQSATVAEIVRERSPAAVSLLDVACGTGLHLRSFVSLFDRVVGLDLSSDMLSFARAHTPGLRVRQADMRSFHAGESFDAVTCMFAVPHLQSTTELDAMVDCFVRHLTPGGVVIIEPWFTPEEFIPGYVASDLIEHDARTIFRVSHTTRVVDESNRVRMVVHYVEGDPESGIHHSTETVHMTLFTHEQYEKAFAKAGCPARHQQLPTFDRGLWIAHRPP